MMGVRRALHSLAKRPAPAPPQIPPLSRPLMVGGSLRCAKQAASVMHTDNAYTDPTSCPPLLSFGIAALSLWGASSDKGCAACQPDCVSPSAQSERTSASEVSSLKQYMDSRPQLSRSGLSPTRNLRSAVMATGLIPRGSQCLPAPPSSNSSRKRNLSYLSTLDNLGNTIELQKNWTSGPIEFIAASSKSNDAPMVVDLAKTLGRGKNNPRVGKRDFV